VRRIAVCLFACGLALAQPRTAWADEGGSREQRAQDLFVQSREAAKRGDYLTACAGFKESQSLVPTPGTLLNLADCEERQGKLVQALTDFEEVGRELDPGDPRAQVAEVRSKAIAARVSHLTLRLAAGAPMDELRITLEPTGQEVPLGSAMRVDPGEYRIVLRSADGSERTLPITLHESESKELVADAPRPSVAPAPDSATSTGTARSRRRMLGFALGGTGVGLLALGTVTGIVVGVEAGTYKHDNATGNPAGANSVASAGRVLGVVSPVALGFGAVGVSFGAYFLVTSGRETVKLSVQPTARGGVLSVAF
jgi:hypothetical protein